MLHNRNRVIGSFEDVVERGQTTVKNSSKNTVKDFANSTKNQVTGGGRNQNQQSPADQGTSEAGGGQNQNQQQMTDKEREEFLSKLYGSSDNQKNNSGSSKDPKKGSGPAAQALGVSLDDPNKDKSPEDIAKLESLRKQLHSGYYQNLVNRPKPKEEPVAEKLEREEKEEKMAELQDENKKPKKVLPPGTKQGTGEMQPGAMG